jgi:spore cortex formation protein SpoVR/YcgB (stage V sporulation)
MVFSCPVCTQEYLIINSLCETCRKVKHYMSCYSRDRVIEILDNVLSRTEDKQHNKIKEEIKSEIENKEYSLRSKKSVKSAQIKRGENEN